MSGGDLGAGLEDKVTRAIGTDHLMAVVVEMQIDVGMSEWTAAAVTGNCHFFDFDGFFVHADLRCIRDIIVVPVSMPIAQSGGRVKFLKVPEFFDPISPPSLPAPAPWPA